MTVAVEQVKKWLKEIVIGDVGIEDYIKIEEGGEGTDKDHEYRLKGNFYTDTYAYSIRAVEGKGRSYLSAGVSLRKSLPGEDWTGGHDLPDGPIVRDTWEKIKNAIIKTELVKLAPKRESLPDTEEEVGPSLE